MAAFGSPPPTGAWRPGDHPGRRQFFTFATDRGFAVESGAVLRMSVDRFLQTPDHVHVVFMDPPYAVPAEKITRQLSQLVDLLEPGGIVVVERSRRTPFEWPDGLTGFRDKVYGETRLWYGR